MVIDRSSLTHSPTHTHTTCHHRRRSSPFVVRRSSSPFVVCCRCCCSCRLCATLLWCLSFVRFVVVWWRFLITCWCSEWFRELLVVRSVVWSLWARFDSMGFDRRSLAQHRTRQQHTTDRQDNTRDNVQCQHTCQTNTHTHANTRKRR